MVAEPWMHRIRRKHSAPSPSPSHTIGILSFEVAATMSRAVHLHRSLSDSAIAHLRTHTLSTPAVLSLVSPSHPHLLALALAEKLDDLNRLAASISTLGRRCSHPALLAFPHVYSDLLSGHLPGSSLLSIDIDASIRRMEKLVSAASSLHTELQTLADLEQSAGKYLIPGFLENKKHQQIHNIESLRDASSLWNLSYDKAVILLARAVCSIHARIRAVFGEAVGELDSLLPVRKGSSPVAFPSGPILPEFSGRIEADTRNGHRVNRGTSPGRRFMDCLSLASSTSLDSGRLSENVCLSRSGTGGLVMYGASTRFGPKSRVAALALPSTVGGSALALHYANVVIIIEKLLRYPHLIGEETRDDLYQMLPSSLRTGLKRSLKSYVKNLAIYDAPLAHNWKDAMERILSWLAPMAHNMIQWQTERNFEQQQIVLRANVLLLETLYFADREKTEAAICELLVGLNYICRYEQQQNALLDCTSSVDFDGCMEWQMQY